MAEQIAQFFFMQIDYELAYVFCLKSFFRQSADIRKFSAISHPLPCITYIELQQPK
jgi:hypothetical protein